MSRPLADLIKDFEADPTQWEIVKIEVAPSTSWRNRGGSSVQELLRHKVTCEEVVRHTLLRPDGSVFADSHFRRDWK